jgi:uncharacterized protein YuzE
MDPIQIRYDSPADAAYIYLGESRGPGSVVQTYACDPVQVAGMINLDFDKDGRLLGIEVLGASAKLLPELLAAALPSTAQD